MGNYIKKSDAMDIVKRTHGDYATAWCNIRDLPTVDAPTKQYFLSERGLNEKQIIETKLAQYFNMKTIGTYEIGYRSGAITALKELLDEIK